VCTRSRPRKEVGHHVEIVAQREILVDRLDARTGGVARRAEVLLLPVEDDLPPVGDVRAGNALDQGRFAGAVVAEQRRHLAGRGLEVDAAQHLHRAEAFRDPRAPQ